MADKKLFFNLNCKVVKAKLKMRFNIKGSAIMNVISPCHDIKNTLPNEIAIRTYRKVHTGPKSHGGGDHDGFFSCEYQLYEFTSTSYHFCIGLACAHFRD